MTAQSPELYEIKFDFLTKRQPNNQALINGNSVLSAVHNSSHVLHHSFGRLDTIGEHPSVNVTGLMCISFIALQPRAQRAMTYQGEEGSEGFLALKKL